MIFLIRYKCYIHKLGTPEINGRVRFQSIINASNIYRCYLLYDTTIVEEYKLDNTIFKYIQYNIHKSRLYIDRCEIIIRCNTCYFTYKYSKVKQAFGSRKYVVEQVRCCLHNKMEYLIINIANPISKIIAQKIISYYKNSNPSGVVKTHYKLK